MKKNNFDRIANFYDLLAFMIFGDRIRKSQTIYFNKIPKHAEILVIGGGSGWILNELFKVNPPKKITYIDASAKMIALSAKNINPIYKDKVNFIVGTENEIKPGEQYDVIITCYFLDLFSQEKMEDVMATLYDSLKTNGIWIFSDFHKNNPESFIKRSLLKIMYSFFRILCNVQAKKLPDIDKGFSKLNMTPLRSDFFYSNMIVSMLLKK
jgi:tRNA (cmo5U34)-methyltransferase